MDTLYYCNYLHNKFDITYICWDFGDNKIETEAVKVIYISRSGGVFRRTFRYLLTTMKILLKTNKSAVIFVKYFKGVCSILRILNFNRKMILDIRTCSVFKGGAKRAFFDQLIRIESIFYSNITVASDGLKKKLGLNDKAKVLPIGSIVICDKTKDSKSLNFLYVESKNFVMEELSKGSVLYIYLSDDQRVMHYSCVSKSVDVGEVRKRITMVEGDAYIYNCFTEKEFRGQGIYRKMLNHIIKTGGFNKYYIACIFSNKASLKVINKVGFINQAHIYYYCFIGVVFKFSSDRIFYKKYFK